ncbi:hypothetical protein Esti_001785 [Eimeria stiedai]
MGVKEAPARDLERQVSAGPPAAFAAQAQLELQYWALKRVRTTVRYAACVGLAAPLAAAVCLFVTSAWAQTPSDKQQRLRLAGCCLPAASAAASLLLSLGGLVSAWRTSCSARVGNALLFVCGHAASVVYCCFACAISSGLLRTIGLHQGPLNLGPSIAFCCVLLLQLLLQPEGALGWSWAAVAGSLLLFLLGTQQLLAALSHTTLPTGLFSFAGSSYLLWLSPLIAAALLAAVLLLLRFTELLLAAGRGGYGFFRPPNPAVHSLDQLTANAAVGKALSLPLPLPPDKQATPLLLSQLFAAELSPRRLGPAALAQQRRTLAGPAAAAAAAEPTAAAAEPAAAADVLTPRQQQGARSKEGAWLVALWLRGPFLLAALGCCCLALSLLLLALAADSEAAARNLQGPAAFHRVADLLLQQRQQQHTFSFLLQTQQQQQQGVPLAPHQQREAGLLLRETQRRHKHQQQHVLQTSAFIEAAGRDSNALHSHPATDDHTQQQQQQRRQQQQKIAAALLLLAVVLLLPLVGSRLGQWVEDLFFAHMVLIKRNPEMLIPPPVLSFEPSNAAAAEAAAAETQTPHKELLKPFVHLTEERVAKQESQGLLGLAATIAPDQHQQQQQQQQQQQ